MDLICNMFYVVTTIFYTAEAEACRGSWNPRPRDLRFYLQRLMTAA